jgi:hypothetical protein
MNEVFLITPMLIGGWRCSRHFMDSHVATPKTHHHCFFLFFENGNNKKYNTVNYRTTNISVGILVCILWALL